MRTLQVDPDDLDRAAAALVAAAQSAGEQRVDLPGRTDYGHGPLSHATSGFADRLQYVLETLAAELDRGADNLTASAQSYRIVDERAVSNLPRVL